MDLNDIHWLGHDSFRLEGSTTIYIDPWKLGEGALPADGILVTHAHYDHLSGDDIEMIVGPQTLIAGPAAVAAKLGKDTAIVVAAGETFEFAGAKVTAVPAYNLNKFRQPGEPYHPREAGGLGYIVELDGFRVYHAGDTDAIPELRDVACDVALLPASGTYVMTAAEAVTACDMVTADTIVPMHFGDIVGSEADARYLEKHCAKRVVILPLERE